MNNLKNLKEKQQNQQWQGKNSPLSENGERNSPIFGLEASYRWLARPPSGAERRALAAAPCSVAEPGLSFQNIFLSFKISFTQKPTVKS